MAHLRGTDVDKAHIGMDIFDPEPDFATLAKSMGVWRGCYHRTIGNRGSVEAGNRGREVRKTSVG